MSNETNQNGIPFLRAPSGYRPKRDRAIPVRSVACPTCRQPAGQACVSAGGTTTSNHPARRRMALRQLDKT